MCTYFQSLPHTTNEIIAEEDRPIIITILLRAIIARKVYQMADNADTDPEHLERPRPRLCYIHEIERMLIPVLPKAFNSNMIHWIP